MPNCAVCDCPVDTENEDHVAYLLYKKGKAGQVVQINHAACEGF